MYNSVGVHFRALLNYSRCELFLKQKRKGSTPVSTVHWELTKALRFCWFLYPLFRVVVLGIWKQGALSARFKIKYFDHVVCWLTWGKTMRYHVLWRKPAWFCQPESHRLKNLPPLVKKRSPAFGSNCIKLWIQLKEWSLFIFQIRTASENKHILCV
jgi:hypothetical protein